MLQAMLQAASDMLASGVQPSEIVATLVGGGISTKNATEIVCYLITIA